MLQVNKYVKIGLIVFLIVIAVAISFWVATVINRNSYNIEEISEWVEETEETVGTERVEDSMWKDTPQSIKDFYSMEQGDISDAEYSVSRALVILKYSPISDDIEKSSYEVKLLNNDWIVKFSCEGYDVFVQCDNVYFHPVSFTFTREFTNEEREYFSNLGNAEEVDNEDGTYTIYFT